MGRNWLSKTWLSKKRFPSKKNSMFKGPKAGRSLENWKKKRPIWLEFREGVDRVGQRTHLEGSCETMKEFEQTISFLLMLHLCF